MVTMQSALPSLKRHSMPSLHRRALSLVAALALSGCAVGPDYQQPDMALPTRFMGQTAIAQRQATNTAEFETWWTGFGSPQLTHFVSLALAQNLDMSQASARLAQARAGLGMANAALLPSGQVGAQVARGQQSLETPLGQVLNATPGFDRYGSTYEANLSAGWELDVFGGLRREREAVLADYQAAEAATVATRLAVAAQTADLYIAIRGLQSRLDIAHKRAEIQQKLLDMVRLLQGKGLASDLQVWQAEGALAQVKAGVPALEAGLASATNAFDVILSAPPGTHRAALTQLEPIPVAPRIADAGSPDELLRRRPDLIVAERRLAAANARIGSAMSEYYPKFSLSAMLGSATAVSSGNLFSTGANQSAAVAGLRWRLFDFGRINAQIELSRGQESEALAAYRQSALRATADVEDAFAALVSCEAQRDLLVDGEASLARAREASLAGYQKGTLSLIEVLLADENLLRAADGRIQSQAASARAAVAAFRSLGGGWTPPSRS